MDKYVICKCCKYAFKRYGDYKTHCKSQKHKRKRDSPEHDEDVLLTEEEKQAIIEQSNYRRANAINDKKMMATLGIKIT